MPNWCTNDLVVSGPKKDVELFVKKAKSDKKAFDFNNFIPYPERFAVLDEESRKNEELLEAKIVNVNCKRARAEIMNSHPRVSDGYNQGGYEWCIQNWGTKWNSVDCEQFFVDKGESGECSATTLFATAWSPPVPVIVKASELFPELLFEMDYDEEAGMYHGHLKVKNGVVIKDECLDGPAENVQGEKHE